MGLEPVEKEILERLNIEVLVVDGAIGMVLFEAGLVNGACPELWNAKRPEVVRARRW